MRLILLSGKFNMDCRLPVMRSKNKNNEEVLIAAWAR